MFKYVFVNRKIKNLQICGSWKSATNIGSANRKLANRTKNIGSVRNSQIFKLPHMWKVSKCNTFCKSTILRIFRGWGKMIHEKYLKLKIFWHCPFKAKHQHTQECTDVTKLYKNTISWDYPFKKHSEWIFEMRYTRIFYFSI